MQKLYLQLLMEKKGKKKKKHIWEKSLSEIASK